MKFQEFCDILRDKNYILDIRDYKIYVLDKFTDVRRAYKFADFNFCFYFINDDVYLLSNYKKENNFKVETYVQSYVKILSKTLKCKINFRYYAQNSFIYEIDIANF